MAAAVGALIEVIGRDKGYLDAGARKACEAMFQLPGPRHPVTEGFFRAFSRARQA